MVATIIWLTVTEYHKWQRIYSVCPHVEQEVPTLPEHFSSPPDGHGVRVVPSLVFCVIFCRSFFFPFLLLHLAIVLSDLRLLIYDFWFTTSDLRLLIYDFWFTASDLRLSDLRLLITLLVSSIFSNDSLLCVRYN
jgi:hypothetical protein